eukprot:m.261206 g.261206  ORF g.261206 m.261206 type:complete len:93 (-) comp11045_c0_seq15:222-500(-)
MVRFPHTGCSALSVNLPLGLYVCLLRARKLFLELGNSCLTTAPLSSSCCSNSRCDASSRVVYAFGNNSSQCSCRCVKAAVSFPQRCDASGDG